MAGGQQRMRLIRQEIRRRGLSSDLPSPLRSGACGIRAFASSFGLMCGEARPAFDCQTGSEPGREYPRETKIRQEAAATHQESRTPGRIPPAPHRGVMESAGLRRRRPRLRAEADRLMTASLPHHNLPTP